FMSAAENLLKAGGLAPAKLTLEGIKVYASYSPQNPKDTKLKSWLSSWLDRQPGYSVVAKPRYTAESPARCQKCGHEVPHCPSCSEKYYKSVEKGIDT